MKTFRLSLVALTVVVIVQLVMPHPVLADDTTPPPPFDGEIQPTEPSQPAGDQQGEATSADAEQPAPEVAPVEEDQTTPEITPAESEQPSLEVTPIEAEQPAPEVAPAEVTATELEQPGEVAATEETTADGILDALPENTDLVILDANNQPIPLATEAATRVIANSDPWWCPEGTSPTSGGCANYADFTALISGLQSLGSLTNGTVYVQEGNYAGPETWITLDGNSLTNVGNLALIGGWDLAAATPSQIGNTTFNVPLSITNWSYSVSIQDINVQFAYDGGLNVQAAGPVTLTDVDSSVNWNNSLSVDGINIKSNSDVTLNNVSSSSNNDDGIYIEADGDVVLNHVSSTSNVSEGVRIVTEGNVTLNDVEALFNYGDGIRVKTDANVTLNDINSSYNGGYGFNITPNASVTLHNVQSEHNFFGIGLGGGGSETVAIMGGENTNLGGNKNSPALCENKSLVTLLLPSGNSLMVYCPISGTLSVKEQGRKGLPAPLPDGLTFVSGLNVTLSQDGAPTQVITDSGHLKPSFVVPAGQTGTPVILYWDAKTNSWVELPAFGAEGSVTLSNGGTVSEGVQLLSNTGLVEVGVNFPGIFVLAVK